MHLEVKFEKIVRGLLFNASLEFWNNVNNDINKTNEEITDNSKALNTSQCKITFESFTYVRSEPEFWFTAEHIHDYQAVMHT